MENPNKIEGINIYPQDDDLVYDIYTIPENEILKLPNQHTFINDSSFWNDLLFDGLGVVPYRMELSMGNFNRIYTVLKNKNKYLKNLKRKRNTMELGHEINVDSVILKKDEYQELQFKLKDFEEFSKNHLIIQRELVDETFLGFDKYGFPMHDRSYSTNTSYYGKDETIQKVADLLNDVSSKEITIENLKAESKDYVFKIRDLESEITKLKLNRDFNIGLYIIVSIISFTLGVVLI